jgi:hypothetical protein
VTKQSVEMRHIQGVIGSMVIESGGLALAVLFFRRKTPGLACHEELEESKKEYNFMLHLRPDIWMSLTKKERLMNSLECWPTVEKIQCLAEAKAQED